MIRTAAVLGALLGAILAGVVGALWADPDEESAASSTTSSIPPPTTAGDDEAGDVDAFLDEWRASRMATWHIETSFTRKLTGGDGFTLPGSSSQRPPDRLTYGFGSIEGRLAGRIVGCAPGPGDELHCRDGGPAPAYDDEVDAELGILGLALGRGASEFPLYAVTRPSAGCFRLDLRFPGYPAPPYGLRSTFCFDPETHAPLRVSTERAEGSDETVTLSVRTTVTDDDLRLPAPLES